MSSGGKGETIFKPETSTHIPPPSMEDDPNTSKKNVKDMSQDDLQALISARIAAGKKANTYVQKIEAAFDAKQGTGGKPAAAAPATAPAEAAPAAAPASPNAKPPVSLNSNPDLCLKEGMDGNDLQALIAARISAGKKSQDYVTQLEKDAEKKLTLGGR